MKTSISTLCEFASKPTSTKTRIKTVSQIVLCFDYHSASRPTSTKTRIKTVTFLTIRSFSLSSRPTSTKTRIVFFPRRNRRTMGSAKRRKASGARAADGIARFCEFGVFCVKPSSTKTRIFARHETKSPDALLSQSLVGKTSVYLSPPATIHRTEPPQFTEQNRHNSPNRTATIHRMESPQFTEFRRRNFYQIVEYNKIICNFAA